MKAVATALNPLQSLQDDYQKATQQYLKKDDESTLEQAYELGRRALEGGLGIVDIAAVHNEALFQHLHNFRTAAECSLAAKRLGRFFVESLSPFEMTHRGYREAQSALLQLNQTLEAEARRIAHALHDEAGQLMVTVHFALEDLGRKLPSGFDSQLQVVRERLVEVEQQLRRLSHELRPPMLDDVGLIPALDFLAQGIAERSGLSIFVEGRVPGRLPPLTEIALYRTVQEALNNVSKHAAASHVTVSLQEQFQGATRVVVCSVKDDGVGFNPTIVTDPTAKRGLGLLGIQERIKTLGGSLYIHSAPGVGTELRLIVPA